ncbi:MAG TPA: type II CAAX endopeptidase family protein [Methanomassiliicoccales archaeon]|nr:type II CAAX endopeptidase family protein [Methanomassiliicoccales archaeon]
MKRDDVWKFISLLELIVAAIVIYLDLLIPTLIVLGLCALSLIVRKEKLSTLGFKKAERPLFMAAVVLILMVVWSLFHLSVSMPILNHITGTKQDLSSFENLQGDLANLAFLLLATWTLAAFGEEIVYRGYLQRRVRDILGDGREGIVVAVLLTSLLFGLAHIEQGAIGVVLTAMDAVVFSAIKLKFDDNLWAAILAHGFSNTVGIVTFFFTGPIYGFW